MGRGFCAVGLQNPKGGENVGGAMRAAGVFGAAFVRIAGSRFRTIRRFPTDTMRTWRHVPVYEVEDLLLDLPLDCVPVAVEFLADARPLPSYTHPARALYVFGPEDGSLDTAVLDRCRDVVMIPSVRCLNLAASVNVVLYDRLAKAWARDAGL